MSASLASLVPWDTVDDCTNRRMHMGTGVQVHVDGLGVPAQGPFEVNGVARHGSAMEVAVARISGIEVKSRRGW